MATKPAVKKKGAQLAVTDPRQLAFLSAFLDPQSKTFSNALQSALKAGYTQEYAESITAKMPSWLAKNLAENVGKDSRIALAEKHLDEVLDMPIITQAMGAFGPIYEKRESFVKKRLKNGRTKVVRKVEKVPVMTYNTSRIKEKSKVVEFALENLKSEEYGRKRGPKLSFTFNAAGTRARYEADA